MNRTTVNRPIQVGAVLLAAVMSVGWQSTAAVPAASAPSNRGGMKQMPPAPPADLVEGIPIAVQSSSGTYDFWVADEVSGEAQLVLSGAKILPIRIVGQPHFLSMRLSQPTSEGQDTPAPHIRLPQGGSLYRLSLGGATALVQITTEGEVRTLVSVPEMGGIPSLLESISVSGTGITGLVASTQAAGGDVFSVDLTGTRSTRVLTQSSAPLDVEPQSLRVTDRSAFLVSEGVFYRCPDPFFGLLSAVNLGVPGMLLPEPVVCELGTRAAVVVEESLGQRWIVIVPRFGSPFLGTPESGDYWTAGYDHPLGPWLSLSMDGQVLAYFENIGPYHGGLAMELFVQDMTQPGPAQHVTQTPDFPVYIDSVGVLGFTHNRALIFFAGDETLSGVQSGTAMGFGDMFLMDFNGPQPVPHNLTNTSGDATPPFLTPGTLNFTEALLDPMGDRFLLLGDPKNPESQPLATFALDEKTYDTSVSELLDGSDEDLELMRVGDSICVLRETDESSGGNFSSPGSSSEELKVDLLRPIDFGPSQLTSLGSLSGDYEIDRATGNGELTAMVVSLQDNKEMPVFLLTDTQVMHLAWWNDTAISPLIDLSLSGRLTFGHGAEDGPFEFVSVGLDGSVVEFEIPAAFGFPLPH
jgi:hypothetical protein